MSGSEVLRIVCWQPVLTEHQSATFEALAEFPDVELIAITSRADNPDKPGWLKKASAAMPVRLLRTHAWFGEIRTLLADPDAVHIVASPFDRSRINVALFLALYRKRAVFLLCEPYATIPLGYFGDGRPWLAEFKHRLRPILYRLYGRLLKHRIAGVFAISPRAVDQFRHMGVAPERIYPFGYFVLPSMGHLSRPTGEPRLRCVFIGALIKRKGIATMLGAFAGSPFLQANATLDIYGKGDIAAADLPEGVRYCGVLPPDQPIRVMAEADVVVVPSLFDGWGVVVNEAILAGTPVVASDAVGAAAMVRKWDCGRIFPAGDEQSLAALLEQLARDRAQLAQLRRATQALAPQLHPKVAARFLRDSIRSRRIDRSGPDASWY